MWIGDNKMSIGNVYMADLGYYVKKGLRPVVVFDQEYVNPLSTIRKANLKAYLINDVEYFVLPISIRKSQIKLLNYISKIDLEGHNTSLFYKHYCIDDLPYLRDFDSMKNNMYKCTYNKGYCSHKYSNFHEYTCVGLWHCDNYSADGHISFWQSQM